MIDHVPTRWLTGRLLVASPALLDPNFDRTVVLVLEHGEEGAVGVVLNRPSSVAAAAAGPAWAALAPHPQVVFVGGPVSAERAVALAVAADPPEEGWRSLFGDIGTVDLEVKPENFRPSCPVRVFAGYAGWGSGQLEAEVEAGGWIVADRVAGDVVSATPLDLWAGVLRRQPPRLSILAGYPRQLRLN